MNQNAGARAVNNYRCFLDVGSIHTISTRKMALEVYVFQGFFTAEKRVF